MEKLTGPCLMCEDRHLGCHSACEKYLTWKAANEERKEKIFVNSAYDRIANIGEKESYQRHTPYNKRKVKR